MKQFVLGIVTGIIICTVGFSGIARIFDHGVQAIQNTARDAAK